LERKGTILYSLFSGLSVYDTFTSDSFGLIRWTWRYFELDHYTYIKMNDTAPKGDGKINKKFSV
jgi:hypothetical protein